MSITFAHPDYARQFPNLNCTKMDPKNIKIK